MTSYVYLTYHPHTGEFYIGSRTPIGNHPYDDLAYFGSGNWIKEMLGKGASLRKLILKIFDRKIEASLLESTLIKRLGWSRDCRNAHGRSGLVDSCDCGKLSFWVGTLFPHEGYQSRVRVIERGAT
jgi:hypothetical protein